MSTSPKRPSGPSSRISRRQVLQAARRYYDAGETQAVIAAELGISPSHLARLLKNAKDAGWVRVFIDADRDDELAGALRAAYPNLQHVEVVSSEGGPEAISDAVATALASWLDDLLDAPALEGVSPIRRVAIGGAITHIKMVERLVKRVNGPAVAPTSLTPWPAEVRRPTSPLVAHALAQRWGAFSVHGGETVGSEPPLVCPTPFRPPEGNAVPLSDWLPEVESHPDYQRLAAFWASADVVFASLVAARWVYPDVAKRLLAGGTATTDVLARGALVATINQFLDARGQVVPFDGGSTRYEPSLPVGELFDRTRKGAGPRHLVFDIWGERSREAMAILPALPPCVLVCDRGCAGMMLGG